MKQGQQDLKQWSHISHMAECSVVTVHPGRIVNAKKEAVLKIVPKIFMLTVKKTKD